MVKHVETKNHPSPDRVGRVHCKKCWGFTAEPNGVHSWCKMGMKRWAGQWTK